MLRHTSLARNKLQYTQQKIQSKLKNTFWKDILLWENVIEKERNFNWHPFLASPLWFNNKIMIGNKSIFYKDWFEKDVTQCLSHNVFL
jgi:hypothetical protein